MLQVRYAQCKKSAVRFVPLRFKTDPSRKGKRKKHVHAPSFSHPEKPFANVSFSVIISTVGRSLNSNAFSKVSRLIYITTPENCHMVSKQLQGYYGYKGGEQRVDRRDLNYTIHIP